jgi:PAS domain-containing protein
VEVADSERRMIGALTDLSERYQAREQMSEVERRFRLLFDRNPAPFWVFDPDTLRFIEVNDAAVRQYGYSRDEFLAMSILDIRPREGWDEVRGAIQRAQVGDPPTRPCACTGARTAVCSRCAHTCPSSTSTDSPRAWCWPRMSASGWPTSATWPTRHGTTRPPACSMCAP